MLIHIKGMIGLLIQKFLSCVNSIKIPVLCIAVNFAQHHGKTTEKVFFLGREPQYLVNIETSLKTTYGDKLSITYSTPVCLEIMNQNVSKATALEQVLAERNYGMQHVLLLEMV